MLNFELLRAFVAVADCGGFHRAAERLNLTQSTVSQQIKGLELETKRPLFRRTTRSVARSAGQTFPLGPQSAAARARREARSAPRRDVSDMMDLLRSMLSLKRQVGAHH